MGQKFHASAEIQINKGEPDYTFYCPACQCDHGIWTSGKNPNSEAIWQWNGDLNNPTVTPSIKVQHTPRKGADVICHFFIRGGKIIYCGDCTHEKAGKVVDMDDIE